MVELQPHNQKAYEKAQEMLKDNNVAAVVHPTLSGIDTIGVKFLGNTDGKKLWIDTNRITSGRIKTLGKGMSSEESQRFGNTDFIDYDKLVSQMNKNKPLEAYSAIVLMGLEHCSEDVWKEGIDQLLERNPNAKVLELVTLSTMSEKVNNSTYEKVAGNIASFISEEEGVVMGFGSPIITNDTYVFENRLEKATRKVNKLEDAEKKKELKEKISYIRDLVKKLEGIIRAEVEDAEKYFAERGIDPYDIYAMLDSPAEGEMTAEEFEEAAKKDLEKMSIRDEIRRLIAEVNSELGEEQEPSRLEELKQRYYGLSDKEVLAQKMLKEVETLGIEGAKEKDWRDDR